MDELILSVDTSDMKEWVVNLVYSKGPCMTTHTVITYMLSVITYISHIEALFLPLHDIIGLVT